MQYIFMLAVAMTILIAWAASDKVVYRGFAQVRLSDKQKRASKRPSVVVLPPLHLKLGAAVVEGFVSPEHGRQIGWTPNTKRTVVLRRRLFGKLRVTEIE
jgi:hypothetical protein